MARSRHIRRSASLVLAALAAVSSAAAQFPCQAPTQWIDSPDPLDFGSFASDGTVDGDTALVLATEPMSQGGTLLAQVLERSPQGIWSFTHTVRFSGSFIGAPGTRRVHLDGDVAAVVWNCGLWSSELRTLERDPTTGLWGETNFFIVPNNCPSIALSGNRLAVGLSGSRQAWVFERTAPADWNLVYATQGPAPPTGFSDFGRNIALTETTLAVADEKQRTIYFYERDAAGQYVLDFEFQAPLLPSAIIPLFGRALDLDDRRGVVSNVEGLSTTDANLLFFERSQATTPRWSYSGALRSDVDGRRQRLGRDVVMADGTAFTTVFDIDGCVPGTVERVVMARTSEAAPDWRSIASVCPADLGAVTSSSAVPLDFDGRTLLIGMPAEDVGGTPSAGRIAIVELPEGSSDCDGDCVDDAVQLANCAVCDLNGNGALDSCEGEGFRYCDPANSNSTGAPGRLEIVGAATVSSVDLVAYASALPRFSFGFLLSGESQQMIVNPAGSDGVLCVGQPSFGRYPVTFSGTLGASTTPIDPTNLPSGPGAYAASVGQTLYFQYWYRDLGTSNLTDALALTFRN